MNSHPFNKGAKEEEMYRILVKVNIFVFVALPLLVALVFVLGIKNANAQNGAMVINKKLCTLTGTINDQYIVATTKRSLRLQTPQGNITFRCNKFEIDKVDGETVPPGEYMPPSRTELDNVTCMFPDFDNKQCPGTIISTPSGNINGVCHCNGRTID